MQSGNLAPPTALHASNGLQDTTVIRIDLYPSDAVTGGALSAAVARGNILLFLRAHAQALPWWNCEAGGGRGGVRACSNRWGGLHRCQLLELMCAC